MAKRWPIAQAATVAQAFLKSRHTTDEEHQTDLHWRDITRRFPLSASLLLLLAESNGIKLIEHVHPNYSMRKAETAMVKGTNFSEVTATDEDEDDEEDEEEIVEAKKPRKTPEPKSTKPAKHAVAAAAPKGDVNVDDLLEI